MADLEEMKATGENSENNDPVVGAGGPVKKRKADLMKEPGPVQAGTPVVTPQGTNNAGLHEMLTAVFGNELSEDFKGKAETLWEAALHERAEAVRAELEEQFEADLNEQVEAVVEEMTDKIDAYLDYVIENWLEENKVALETGYKVHVAESLLAGIKALVEDHNIEVEDSEIDVVAELEAELEESTQKYNELVESLIEERNAKEALERQIAFAEISEGMVATDAARFKVLSEGVEFEDVESFSRKLATIKESYFTESTVRAEDQAEMLEEETLDESKAPAVDPTVAAYVATLNRFVQK